MGGHISGQMKIASEHVSDDVLKLMGKPSSSVLLEFKDLFEKVKTDTGKEVYLTYYLIAAHPGCYEHHMKELVEFCHDRLKTIPEQVQIFTPTPSTVSTKMYHVRRDWKDTVNIKAGHSMQMKQRQKDIVLSVKSNVRNGEDDRGQRRDAVRQQSNKSYKLTVVSDNKSAPYKGRRPSNGTFRNNAKNDIIRKKK